MVMYRVGGTSDRLWNPTNLVEYLSQHQKSTVNLIIDPEAICLETIGLYKLLDCFNFKQVNIHTSNPLEKHNKYNIVYTENYRWFYDVNKIDPSYHVWNRTKLFYCLYGRPTASRLGLAGFLNDNYRDQSLIHFSANLDDDNLIQFELDKLLGYRIESIQEAGNLINQLPMLLGSTELYTAFDGYNYTDPLTNFYRDILIDVVVESHVSGRTFYATEKTVRPILLKKPFIVFASRDYLDYLHQMGFKTFCNFWDENYDGFEGRDRFNKILKLIESLAQKSPDELLSMYTDMQDVLDYNYDLLINRKFNKTIKEIV